MTLRTRRQGRPHDQGEGIATVSIRTRNSELGDKIMTIRPRRQDRGTRTQATDSWHAEPRPVALSSVTVMMVTQYLRNCMALARNVGFVRDIRSLARLHTADPGNLAFSRQRYNPNKFPLSPLLPCLVLLSLFLSVPLFPLSLRGKKGGGRGGG